MQASIQPLPAASLGMIWSALHACAQFLVSRDELHFLRMVALGLDDDLASHLLIAKLKLATVVEAEEASLSGIVSMNSFVEFSFDGHACQLRQLVHPSDKPPNYGLEVDTLLGAGVLGLRAGQLILWPDSDGRLCDLHILKVANREHATRPPSRGM